MKKILFSFLIVFPCVLFSQQQWRFSVRVDKSSLNQPLSIPLDNILRDSISDKLRLFEILDGKENEIACQLETGYSSKLWFILQGLTSAGSERKFVLKTVEKNRTPLPHSFITLTKNNDEVIMQCRNKPILAYRFSTINPPDGVSPLFKKSGFIHPLFSPEGEILTRIQAPDHYHHFGIWGPWTLTKINHRKVDFWNIGDGLGTVRFSDLLLQVTGPVFTEFEVSQHHIDFGNKGEDQVALNEKLDVRAWNLSDKVWVIDYTTTINTPLDSGILFEAYRYGGGIGFRATEKWTKDNSSVLTSDGKTRIDADGSMARWCIVEGQSETKSGRSGILFLSHPSNRMHPEPMRVWPIDANGGRGDMFFEFTPIRYQDWKIEPYQNYTLRYRIIVFDGKIDKETAELYWNSFGNAPIINFTDK